MWCKQEEFFLLTPHMKMEQNECYEMSAHKIQTPGNHPKEKITASEQGESLKSRKPENRFTTKKIMTADIYYTISPSGLFCCSFLCLFHRSTDM
jgi:hypothetical protein